MNNIVIERKKCRSNLRNRVKNKSVKKNSKKYFFFFFMKKKKIELCFKPLYPLAIIENGIQHFFYKLNSTASHFLHTPPLCYKIHFCCCCCFKNWYKVDRRGVDFVAMTTRGFTNLHVSSGTISVDGILDSVEHWKIEVLTSLRLQNFLRSRFYGFISSHLCLCIKKMISFRL